MYFTIGTPTPANDGFVEEFRGYVERWMKRMQSQGESQGAGSDAKGPGRPPELPAAVCVGSGARSARPVARVGVPGL
jgi:hypothetical protein